MLSYSEVFTTEHIFSVQIYMVLTSYSLKTLYTGLNINILKLNPSAALATWQ